MSRIDAGHGGVEGVKKLLCERVPELASGAIEIRAIAREPGERTIIALHSNDPSVDAIAVCLRNRGAPLTSIVTELSGERIDLVRWSDSTSELLRNCIAPVKADFILLDPATREAMICAPLDCVSSIVGGNGKRIELISELTGWNVTVTDV